MTHDPGHRISHDFFGRDDLDSPRRGVDVLTALLARAEAAEVGGICRLRLSPIFLTTCIRIGTRSCTSGRNASFASSESLVAFAQALGPVPQRYRSLGRRNQPSRRQHQPVS